MHPLGSMLVSACVLAGGGVFADLVFPVLRWSGGGRERLWGDTGFMVGLSLAVYVPAVVVGLLFLLRARRGRGSVAVQERVAALAGLGVVGVLVFLWFAPLFMGPEETLAGGLNVTTHPLHYPVVGVALCVAVLVSVAPAFRRWRSR